MALSIRARRLFEESLGDHGAAKELGDAIAGGPTSLTPTFTTCNVGTGGYKVSGTKVVGAQASAVAGITTTYTAGSAPTAGTTQTIAAAATPTVVELLQYCKNLEGRIAAIITVLHNHGLTA